MVTPSINLGHYSNLNNHTVINLYLYGTIDTPAHYVDRLRSKAAYDALPKEDPDGLGQVSVLKVKIESAGYMADGGADNFVEVASIFNQTGLTDEEALETSGNLITA